jgi:hypothetical protein
LFQIRKKFVSKKKNVRIQQARSRKKGGKCPDKIGIDRNKFPREGREIDRAAMTVSPERQVIGPAA